jgi:hypothetical protein
VLSVNCVPRDPEAPFGNLESGSIEIEGPVKQMQWRYTLDNSVPDSFLSEFRWKDEKTARYIDYKGKLHMDALEEEADWEEVIFLCIGSDNKFFCEGIILTKSGDDRYRRIGYFDARMNAQEDDDIDGSFTQIPRVVHWPRSMLVII